MFKSTNYLKKQEIEKRKAMIELRRKNLQETKEIF